MYPNNNLPNEVKPTPEQALGSFGMQVNGTQVAPPTTPVRPKRSFALTSQAKVSMVVVAIILAITGGTILSRRLTHQNTGQVQTVNSVVPDQDLGGVTLPVDDSPSLKLQGTSDALIVNGDVISRGALKLYGGQYFSNIAQGTITADRTMTLPDAAGTVCIDTNNCGYAASGDVTTFQNQIALLQGQVPTITTIPQNLTAGSGVNITGNTLSNAGVLSVNGQTGALNFTAGAGIVVNGTAVTSSGVRSLHGSGNVIISDVGNGILNISDVGAGAATVTLGPPLVQEDTSNNAAININKTGTGNLLRLSTGSTPTQRFVVDQTGAISTGSLSFSQLTSVPNLVNTFGGVSGAITLGTGVGVSGQSLLNTGVTSINGQTGDITITGDVGIVVDDGTITNAGVTKLTGTAHQVIVSGQTGDVTVSLPQSIGVSSSPTFAGLTVAGATVNGDLTLKGSSTGGNNFVITGNATTGRTITLPDASGTVCLAANNCSYQAAGNYINLQLTTPGSQQTGNINVTGTVIAGTQLTSPLLDSSGSLTLAGTSATSLTLGRSGVGALTPGGVATQGGNITTTGGYLDINTGTITAGLVNGQQITAIANFTGSLTVAGATTLTGAVTTNTVTGTGSMTIGNVAQALTFQGTTTSIVSHNGAGTHTTTLTFADPTADVTYRLQSAAAGTYDICSTTGNCSGVGGGVTTSGGVAGQLAYFTGAQGIGSSIISDNGSTVTVGGNLAVNTITPTGTLTAGSPSYNLVLQGAATTISSTNGSTTNTVSFATPSGSNKTIVFPDASGTVCLNNGNCAGAGSGLTGTGTANRVARFSAAQNLVNASLTDTGSNATATGTFSVGGLLQANAVRGNTSLTLGLTSQASTLQGSATTVSQTNSTFTNSLVFAAASGSNKTLTLPNETGTICTTGSICTGYQAAGTYVNLQAVTPGSPQIGNINVSGTIIGATSLTSSGTISSGSTLSTGTTLAVGGNATITGTLGVTGITTLNGSTVANGTATFRPTSNGLNTFSIQNATGGSLFNVDSTNSNLSVNSLNTGEVQAWQTNANTLPANRYLHGSAAYNGYVYVTGGFSGSAATNTVYYAKLNADGSTGTWSTNANTLPATRLYHTSVAANGYLYVIGGSVDAVNELSTVYYAKLNTDGSTGAWSTNANTLPVGRFQHASVTANGYVYVLGGVSSSTVQATVYYAKLNADGSTGAWQTNANDLPSALNTFSAVTANGYIYAVGGGGTTVYYASLNLDGSTSTWQSTTSLPASTNGNAAVVANGYLYVLGGSGSTAVRYAKFNTNGTIGSWTAATNVLPAGRQGHTAITYNGYIYAIGGSPAVTTVYYASLSRVKVGGTLDLTSLSSETNLVANNGTFAGTLQASGAATVGSSLAVAGSTTTNGLYSSDASTFQSSTNSTTFFQVQNAAGSSAFNVDTTNLRVGIGSTAPTTTLDVRGDALFKNPSDSTTAFQVQRSDATALFRVDTSNSSVKVGNQQYAESSTWSTNANALPQSLYGTASVGYNGFVYALGGYNGTTFQTTVYYAAQNANGSTGTWTTNANALPGYVAYTTPVVYGGRMYVLSGAAGNTIYYSTIAGNGSLGTWTTSPTTLPATLSRAAVVTYNGYLYVIGGDNGSGSVSTVYYSAIAGDGTLGAWSTNANALPAALQGLSATTNNGFMYVTGGSTTTPQTTVYYATINANGSIGTWTTSGNALPNTRSNHTSVVSNNYLYVVGGFQQGSGAQSTVYYSRLNSDGSNGTWSTNANALPATRELHGTALLNSYLYVLAGRDASSTLQSTVYYAKLPTDPTSTTAFQVTNASGTAVFTVDTTNQKITLNGTINNAVTFKNDTNSTTAFNIQNAVGSNLFTADTTNNKISFNATLPGELGPWATNANALPAARSNHSSVTANGYVYAIGGSSSATVYYAKLNADGSTGAWQTNANALPAARSNHSSVTANGYVYVLGGDDTSSTPQATVYYAKLNADGSTGTWSTSTNVLPEVRERSSSVTANGYMYVIGGRNLGAPRSIVYYAKLNADGSTGAWQTNANALPGVISYHSSVITNGYVYVLGGNNGSNQATVYYAKLNADGSTGAWQTNANALPGVRASGAAAAANGYVYMLAGTDGSSGQATVYYAKLNTDGSTGVWSTNTNALPASRLDLSSVLANGYVYAIGGSNQATVYYASVARTQVGGSLDLTSLNGAGGGDLYAGGITASGPTNLQGQVSLNPTTDSATLFQVNNSLGQNLLNVDSSTATITLNGGQNGDIQPWKTNANALPAGKAEHATVVANGYIYTLGGGAAVYYAKLNADGTTGAWVTNANSLPISATSNTAVVANGYIYSLAGSGVTATYYAKLNADGSTGTWITASSVLSEGRERHGSIVANGYVYVIGGQNGSSSSRNTVFYAKLNADGSLGAWGSTTVVPALLTYPGVTAANGYVYVTGGNNGSTAVSTVYYAKLNTDGTIGAWSTNTNALNTGRFSHVSVAVNGYLYAIGGQNFGGGLTSAAYAKLNADGSTGIWQASSYAMPALRTTMSGAVANGYIYVPGGRNSTAQTTVYYTSTSRILAGGSLDLVGTSNGNLAEGGGGSDGSIYAGNGDFLGTLSVREQATFLGGVSVDKELAVRGSALFQNATNSTTTFQIQNSAGGSLFNVDSTNSNISINSNNTGETQAWRTGSNALTAARYYASSATANGYVYVLGGYNSGAQSTVYYAKLNADGSTGTWTTNANALTAARYGLAATTANGYLYVVGGRDGSGTYQSTVYYAKLNADGSTGTWTTNANPVTQVLYQATATVANGYMYVVGGDNGSSAQSTVYYAKLNADGSTGTWTTNANALTAARYGHSAVVSNGYLYILGGFNSGTQSTVYYAKLNADGSTGTWTTNANALTAARRNHTSVVVNGYVYVITGLDSGGATTSTVYYAKLNANGSAGAWSTSSAAVTAALEGTASIVANGYIYAIGGHNGTSAQNTVYYTSTARILVGGSLDLVGAAATGNLADGGLGGNLTANNGEFLGSLSVRDQANFTGSVSVGGEFVGRGSTLFANSVDSTSSFQIQTSGGNVVFNADTSNQIIKIGTTGSTTLGSAKLLVTSAEVTTTLRVGDATNGFDLSGSSGISFRGTARPTRRIRLAAEYPGAVMDADGSNNTGVLSSGFDSTSGIKMNYYKWTTGSGTAQDYDILIRVPVPQDFSAWAASNPLSIQVYNSDTTAGNIQIEITDSVHTTAGTMTDITAGSASTWTAKTPNVLIGTYTAGDSFTIRLRLTSPTGADIRVGNITLDYLAGN